MLTRRHIRVKVLQSIYAFDQSEHKDIEKQEKFLHYSIDQMMDLHLLLLQLMAATQMHAEKYLQISQKKHLATSEEKNPSHNLINNQVIRLIAEDSRLQEALKNKKLNYWKLDDEYVAIVFNSLRGKEFYESYLKIENPSFKDDRDFVKSFYKKVIAPNDKLYDYLEDKRLTWLDDFPIVNTGMMKILSKLTENNIATILIPNLYKNSDDREYVNLLFRKVVLNNEKLENEIEGKTPNWDKDRIADLDMIILKLGIAELLYFPSIPTRVTINEYLEIAKEYSTPKSSIFINGILDKLVKEFTASKRLKKVGRGLL